jgi:hypothetical protein
VAAATVTTLLAAVGCSREKESSPAGFEPTRAESRSDGRIARCNTVHSLTLPQEVLHRYDLVAGENTAVLSCSLQMIDGSPDNIPARISGTATTLLGTTTPLNFKEILEERAVSYVTTFDLTARSEIRFDIQMVDEQTGRSYAVEFSQVELPGRR